MRILVATRIYAPEAGAAAYRLAATVRALVETGHDVTVLTTRAPKDPSSSAHGAAARSAEGTPAAKPAKLKRWPVLRDKTGAVRG
ncbi:MAG TPA: glycosyltransferase WbuB, partial [Arthrobacter sp.]|nr:glycosyltransferase WbuB [Arthrobacter sp.]